MKAAPKPTRTLTRTLTTTLVTVLSTLVLPMSALPLVVLPRAEAAPPPGAYELLARVDAAYRSLSAYADTGTLEVVAPGGLTRRYVLETRWSTAPADTNPGSFDTASLPTFFLRLDRVPVPGSRTPWKVLWRSSTGEVRHWDADRHQVKTAVSLAAEVAHHLPEDAGWPGGADALPVPALLLGLDVLRNPDAAALEGEVACRDDGVGGPEEKGPEERGPEERGTEERGTEKTGVDRCRVLALSRLNGSVAMWLWVEEESGWIRRAEVEVRQPFGSGVAPGTGPATPERWRLRWEIDPRVAIRGDRPSEETPGAADEVQVAFQPPADARTVGAWERTEIAGEVGGETGDQEPNAVFGEVIEVGLTTVRVRVVDRAGRPISGLSAEDFRVTVRPDRKATEGGGSREPIEVPVVAVDRVAPRPSSRPEGGESPKTGERGAHRRTPTGLPPDGPWTDPFAADAPALGAGPDFQRVLLFVQSGIHALRTRGHLRFLPWVRDLLERLPPGDPVAVVGFDSHLKLWQDFTLDRAKTYDAVYGAVHFGGRPAVPRASERGPLYEHLDFEAAKKAAEPEAGLEVAARALAPLPGPKTVIWLGWGLGRLSSGRVRPKPEYHPARRALEAAEATVFVVDVTDAAWHDLEFGLRQVAADTGGTYAKAHERPDALIRNLTANVSGHYLLHLDRAGLPSQGGELVVELVADPSNEAGVRGARVLLPPSRWEP